MDLEIDSPIQPFWLAPHRNSSMAPLPPHRAAHRMAVLVRPSPAHAWGRGLLCAVRLLPHRQHLREVSGVRRDNDREGRNMKYAKWRQRLRGTCKWGGVTLCVLLACSWLFSLFGGAIYSRWTPKGLEQNFGVLAGGILYRSALLPLSMSPIVPGSNWMTLSPHANLHSLIWLPTKSASGFFLPFWIPIALFAFPTWRLFVTKRGGNRLGCCAQCSYDLTGNTSGKCPECGVRHAVATSDQITSGVS